MQKFLFAIFLLTTGMPAWTQYSYEPGEEEPLPERRNSIGLYITSPTSILMAANPYTFRAGIAYKHFVKGNKRIRIQAIADFPDFGQENGGDEFEIQSYTDSTVTYFSSYEDDMMFNLRAGFEWSRPAVAIAPVYGIDLIAGARFSENGRYYHTYPRDTVAQVSADFSYLPVIEPISGSKRRYILAGAALTAGWRFVVQDTFELQAHFSPEFYYTAIFSDEPITPEGGTSLYTSSLYFRLRIIELTLHYRF
ncbi:MAG: hypothetical protein JNM00_01635 [Flavobacteriales bacterium]|nr:hypothetical protein [Flavobacteriales bacterium]